MDLFIAMDVITAATSLNRKRTSDAYFDGIVAESVNYELTGGAVLFVDRQKTRRAAPLQITTCFHNFTR